MSYVSLTPCRNFGKIAVLSAIALLAGIPAVLVAADWPPARPAMPQVAAISQPKPQPQSEPQPVAAEAEAVTPTVDKQPQAPYDITLNASELAPPEQIRTLADALPASVVEPRAAHDTPPADIDVSTGDEAPRHIKPAAAKRSDAERQAQAAAQFAAAGDLQEAMRAQHLAAELAPNDMLYRLQLAILYDRAGDRTGAAALYRQVVAAYDLKDASLPRDIGIDDIRQRAEYLVATDSR